MIKIKKKVGNNMKTFKLLLLLVTLSLISTSSFAEEKTDCSKIKNETLVGNLKYILCKKNSDKLDKDGNFKKGLFNVFKKK